MLLQSFPWVGLLSLVSLVQGTESYNSLAVARSDGSLHRQLQAARLVSGQVARDDSIPLRKEIMLHYIEDTDNESPLAAHMALSAELPTLLLEDMDSEISKVECDQSSIQLELLSNAYTALKTALKPYKEFYTVTSHESCNSHGGRLPYYVSDVVFSDQDSTVTLETSPVKWKNVYKIDLNFGSDDQQYQRYVHGLSRRQAYATTVISGGTEATTVTTSSAAATTSVASSIATVTTTTIPQGASTTDAEVSLATSFINTVLLNASAEGLGIGLTCLNCSSFGKIDIVAGTATSQPNQTTTGSIAVDVNGFGVFVSLELDISVDANIGDSVKIPWFKVGLPGLSIVDVGSIGPSYEPSFAFTSHEQVNVSLTSGFEMHIPDKSSIYISLSPANISISGFDGTTFDMLPFSAKELDPTADFNISLHQELLFGVDFFDGGFSAEAGIFLDAPKLELKVETLDHVDVNCNPTNDSSVFEPISSRFGNLTNLEPLIDFDGGAKVDGSVLWVFGTDKEKTIFDKDIALPTLCLAHELLTSATAVSAATLTADGISTTITAAAASNWQAASVALSSATATASPTNSAKKNAAPGLRDSCHLLSVGGALLFSMLLVFV